MFPHTNQLHRATNMWGVPPGVFTPQYTLGTNEVHLQCPLMFIIKKKKTVAPSPPTASNSDFEKPPQYPGTLLKPGNQTVTSNLPYLQSEAVRPTTGNSKPKSRCTQGRRDLQRDFARRLGRDLSVNHSATWSDLQRDLKSPPGQGTLPVANQRLSALVTSCLFSGESLGKFLSASCKVASL